MSLKLTYNGLSKSVGYWVNAYDLSENSIRTRLQQRRNGEELTDEEVIFGKRRAREELPTEAKLMYNGISGSVDFWVQRLQLNEKKVRNRLYNRNKGLNSFTDAEVLLGKNWESLQYRLCYDDVYRSVKDWCRIYNLDQDLVRNRLLSRRGESDSYVLFGDRELPEFAPMGERVNLLDFKEESCSLEHWCDRYQLNIHDVTNRYTLKDKENYTPEQILFGPDATEQTADYYEVRIEIQERMDRLKYEIIEQYLPKALETPVAKTPYKPERNVYGEGLHINCHNMTVGEIIDECTTVQEVATRLSEESYASFTSKHAALSPYIDDIDEDLKLTKREMMQLLCPRFTLEEA